MGEGVPLKIGSFPIQTPSCAQLGFGIQLSYKAPSDL